MSQADLLAYRELFKAELHDGMFMDHVKDGKVKMEFVCRPCGEKILVSDYDEEKAAHAIEVLDHIRSHKDG